MKKLFDEIPYLEGERIILKQITEKDLEALQEMACSNTVYRYRDHIHAVSIGTRLREKYWKCGIATDVAKRMVDYLFNETDIEIITASTMVENKASAHVLEKNGFMTTRTIQKEDWGHAKSTDAYRWFL